MKKLITLILALALTGCVSISRTEGARIDRAKVLELKPGATTRQAVIESFGNPTEVTFENNEEKMVYTFKEKKTPAYLGGLVENEVKSTVDATTLELVFRDNIIYSYRFKSSQN